MKSSFMSKLMAFGIGLLAFLIFGAIAWFYQAKPKEQQQSPQVQSATSAAIK